MRTPATYTFDASKDTSFVVERSSGRPMIIFSIEGNVADSVLIYINYHESKGYDHQRLEIKLDSGKIDMKNQLWDFYADKALFTLKHLNNKKGKLTIKASL